MIQNGVFLITEILHTSIRDIVQASSFLESLLVGILDKRNYYSISRSQRSFWIVGFFPGIDSGGIESQDRE